MFIYVLVVLINAHPVNLASYKDNLSCVMAKGIIKEDEYVTAAMCVKTLKP